MEICDSNLPSWRLFPFILQPLNATFTGLNFGVFFGTLKNFPNLFFLRVILNLELIFFSIGGISFSCLMSDDKSLGSSTAIYGMIGSYLALMMLSRIVNEK